MDNKLKEKIIEFTSLMKTINNFSITPTNTSISSSSAIPFLFIDKPINKDKIMECKKLLSNKQDSHRIFKSALLAFASILSIGSNPKNDFAEVTTIYKKLLASHYENSLSLALSSLYIHFQKLSDNFYTGLDNMLTLNNSFNMNVDYCTLAASSVYSSDISNNFKNIKEHYIFLSSTSHHYSEFILNNLSNLLLYLPGTIDEKCSKLLELSKSLKCQNCELTDIGISLLPLLCAITDDYADLANKISYTEIELRNHKGFGKLSLKKNSRYIISSLIVSSTYLDKNNPITIALIFIGISCILS